jgi:hypothetical protein
MMDARERQLFLIGALIGACMEFDAFESGRPLVAGEILDILTSSENDPGFREAFETAEKFLAAHEARRRNHVT